MMNDISHLTLGAQDNAITQWDVRCNTLEARVLVVPERTGTRSGSFLFTTGSLLEAHNDASTQ
jgi:hypothetical protein